MSDNKYADELTAIYEEEKPCDLPLDSVLVALALIKELQTLNNTLKELKKEVNEINMGLPID